MSVKVFLEGGRAKVTALFTDDAGTPTDPSTVTFTVKHPSGVLTPYVWPGPPVDNPAVGTFVIAFDIEPGTYKVNVQGAGAVHAAAETMFLVEESHVV